MNIQFKKGVLELCVLTILKTRDCYGYELVSELSNRIAISEGTIYPLLRRLKTSGYVSTYLKESKEGPPRKYYRITDDGVLIQMSLVREWEDFVCGVGEIIKTDLGGGNKND